VRRSQREFRPDEVHAGSAGEQGKLELVKDAGFEVSESRFFPASGLTLDQARRQKSTISVALIAARRRSAPPASE